MKAKRTASEYNIFFTHFYVRVGEDDQWWERAEEGEGTHTSTCLSSPPLPSFLLCRTTKKNLPVGGVVRACGCIRLVTAGGSMVQRYIEIMWTARSEIADLLIERVRRFPSDGAFVSSKAREYFSSRGGSID